VAERGKPYRPVPPLLPVGTFGDSRAEEVVRDGRRLIEYSTPISFAGRRLGIASLGLSTEGLATAQRSIRRIIFAAAAVILVLAFFGTLLLSSLITTPVKRLHHAVLSLAGSDTYQPVPARSSDELGALTRNFNRNGGDDPRPEVRPAKEGASAGGSVRQHGPRHRGVSGSERPVHEGAFQPAWRGCRACWGAASGWMKRSFSNLERAAIFHDIGKIQTPDDVLRKGERLSLSEEEMMRNHPANGTEILRMAPFLHRYIPAVRAHHEWYNGEGYPDGLKGTRSRSTPRSSLWQTPSTR